MTTKTVFFGARRADGTGLGARNSLTRSNTNGLISRSPRALHAFLSPLRAKRARNKRSPLRRSFLLIPFAIALASLALSPAARAVSPAPDGGYPNFNTAEGDNALLHLTTGCCNTAIGNSALQNNTTGNDNTAIGNSALRNNTTGHENTATGEEALISNTTGINNTAIGYAALASNTTGINNTANGFEALAF